MAMKGKSEKITKKLVGIEKLTEGRVAVGMRRQLSEWVSEALERVVGREMQVEVNYPEDSNYGDYSSNVAMTVADKGEGGAPGLAGRIAESLNSMSGYREVFELATVAGQGFVNMRLKDEELRREPGVQRGEEMADRGLLVGKKVMVEYAHPNTHKEMHIGHMRTLITGEALARLWERCGATVYRANYQGDIGPHVAKSIWGTRKILAEREWTWSVMEKMSLEEKAHLLGEGYVVGSREYEVNKAEIDALNEQLYAKDRSILDDYVRTKWWSLKYYDAFYSRFGTQFDRLYLESEVAAEGKMIVEENVGKVFAKSDGAIVFEGEKYGLHTRVFVTSDGNPTYEGKEMGLAPRQYADFPFDLNVHVVANEQSGYFEVVLKALELLDAKFAGREYHLPMGMVNLVGRKISSRTGEIVTVDGLLDSVMSLAAVLMKNADMDALEKKQALERITVGAVKYSVLRSGTRINVAFDAEKSVSLEGDSGPYLQYTYARARSVLRKAGEITGVKDDRKMRLNDEERDILRWLYRFEEIVAEAGVRMTPNLICGYLYKLAGKFNLFYNKHSILGGDNVGLRLNLTRRVSEVLKEGLRILGIDVVERM